jgi:hypothetical protein
MFPGSPAPLAGRTPLSSVLRLVVPGPAVGVWMRGCRRMQRWRSRGLGLVVGQDLGALLRCCDHVVVRDGGRPVVVAAHLLIRWRVLEIVLGTPFLPPPRQLRLLFPGLRSSAGTLAVPLGLGSAEEALAVCAHERLPVVSSRIAYRHTSG